MTPEQINDTKSIRFSDFAQLNLLHPKSNNDLKKEKEKAEPIRLSLSQDFNKPLETSGEIVPISYPVVSLSKYRMCVYVESQGFAKNRGSKDVSDNTRNAEKFTGELSKRSKRKIINIVENWTSAVQYCYMSDNFREDRKKGVKKPSFSFATLTLSAKQTESDKVVKSEMLNHFFIKLKREIRKDNKDYNWKGKTDRELKHLWVCEPQKNGNIHFHIIFDCFIPHQMVRDVWNAIQEKMGYIDRFQAKHDHDCPPSTDITGVKSIKSLSRYVAKYIVKGNRYRKNDGSYGDLGEDGSNDSGYRRIEGRLWSCSQGLGKIENFSFLADREFWAAWFVLVADYQNDVFEDEYFSVYNGNCYKFLRNNHPFMFSRLKKYLGALFDYIYYHNKDGTFDNEAICFKEYSREITRDLQNNELSKFTTKVA